MIDSMENEIFDDLDCGSLIVVVDAGVGFELNKFVILISCGDVWNADENVVDAGICCKCWYPK